MECLRSAHPISHLLPGISEISFVVIKQQRYDRIAMQGIAVQTGMTGLAGALLIINPQKLLKKNICIRYMPYEHFEISVIILGALVCLMQVNIRNMPKVAQSTLGLQNINAHSSAMQSTGFVGSTLIQNDHAVKSPPMTKHSSPIFIHLDIVQLVICTLI